MTYRLKKNLIILVIAILLIPTISFSEVNFKNGGFYVSYTDLRVSGGDHELAIVRTYNSKSKEKGWFGYGWGSLYETKLVVSGDGSVFVVENGSGAETRFVPKTAIDVDGAIKKIFDAAKANKDFISDPEKKSLTALFKSNALMRKQYLIKYKIESAIAPGTTFTSQGVQLQTLVKDKDGFKRTNSEERSDYFDNKGRLIKIVDKNGYFVDINYKNDVVTTIKDSQGTQIVLEWTPQNTIKSASSTGDKKARYTYNSNGDLIESFDIQDNNFKYTYDSGHDLTNILYADKTQLQIKYIKDATVSEVIERNGDVTTYKYEKNPKRPDTNFWTNVSTKFKDGGVSTSRFEYEMKSKLDGQQYLYRTATEIYGIKTETIFSECCTLPLKITQEKSVVNFDYNERGQPIKKIGPDENLQYEYESKLKKVSKIINGDAWTSFEYDKAGNLSKLETSKGKLVTLSYGRLGEITSVVDQTKDSNKTKLIFTLKYNQLKRPTEISLNQMGSILISYDSYGDVKEIVPKGSTKVSMMIIDAFQEIADLLRPAGVIFEI